MTPRRRQIREEPARCVCEPGSVAHAQHAKPGKKVALHLHPKCKHSELTHTTKPAPRKAKGVTRLRLQ